MRQGIQPAEVLVQTVRNDNAPLRQPQRLRDLDVRPLPIRHAHEGRQVAGMVKADMDLDRPLALAVLRPREHRQAQVDVGRVQGYQRVLEPESVAGRHAAAAVQKTSELQLEELVRLSLVDACERGSRDPSDSEMVELLFLGLQIRHHIPQAAPPRELRHRHGHELAPPTHGAELPPFVVPRGVLLELMSRHHPEQLSEHGAMMCHGSESSL